MFDLSSTMVDYRRRIRLANWLKSRRICLLTLLVLVCEDRMKRVLYTTTYGRLPFFHPGLVARAMLKSGLFNLSGSLKELIKLLTN